ncbi:MAG TPA: hypothetical protein PKC28_14855 [Bdellovibrionales bacterium]|nr:hypothetical protein [Bdellovibrionales bacterium]
MINTFLSFTLICSWQNSPNYPVGYYRPASFQMKVYDSTSAVEIKDQGYFTREYRPCWTGKHKSCGFSFNAEGVLQIERSSKTKLELLKSDLAFPMTLDLEAARPWQSLKINDTVSVTVDGDDGDGSFIDHEPFTCERVQ